MKLEETIQTILDRFPILFGDRESVLLFLFCYYGTGYEWQNGELVYVDTEDLKEFTGKLDPDGKAKQHYDIKNIALKSIYDNMKEQNGGKDVVSFEVFLERMTNLLTEEDSEDKLLEKAILTETIDSIKNNWKVYFQEVEKMLDKSYSPIYNLPEDIKEDWKNGAEETKKILSKINITI